MLTVNFTEYIFLLFYLHANVTKVVNDSGTSDSDSNSDSGIGDSDSDSDSSVSQKLWFWFFFRFQHHVIPIPILIPTNQVLIPIPESFTPVSVNVTNTCCCNYYRYWVGPLMTGIVLLLSTSGLISIVMYRLMIQYKYKRSQSLSDGTSSDSLISQLKELKASTLPGSYIVRNSIITAVVTLLFLSTLFHSVSTFMRGV